MKVYDWNKSLWDRLNVRRASLPHALLLRGPKGVGKRDFAQALAASLLCRTPTAHGSSCGECASCRWFAAGNHPDFRWIQPEAATAVEGEGDSAPATSSRKPSKLIRIDQARELGSWLSVGAHQGGFRVAIINPAEAMNLATANALLKTLEEPPPRTVLLLVSHAANQLLATIRSRCFALDFRVPDTRDAARWLDGQGIAAPQAALALAGGAPLAARDGAERLITSHALIAALAAPRLDPILTAANFRANPLPDVIDLLQRWTIDLAHTLAGLPIRYYPDAVRDLERSGRGVDLARVIGFHRRLLDARQMAEHPLAPQLVLEELFVEYTRLRKSHA